VRRGRSAQLTRPPPRAAAPPPRRARAPRRRVRVAIT
jgi:hypothetical protein